MSANFYLVVNLPLLIYNTLKYLFKMSGFNRTKNFDVDAVVSCRKCIISLLFFSNYVSALSVSLHILVSYHCSKCGDVPIVFLGFCEQNTPINVIKKHSHTSLIERNDEGLRIKFTETFERYHKGSYHNNPYIIKKKISY